jgi:hypothetical protein
MFVLEKGVLFLKVWHVFRGVLYRPDDLRLCCDPSRNI